MYIYIYIYRVAIFVFEDIPVVCIPLAVHPGVAPQGDVRDRPYQRDATALLPGHGWGVALAASRTKPECIKRIYVVLQGNDNIQNKRYEMHGVYAHPYENPEPSWWHTSRRTWSFGRRFITLGFWQLAYGTLTSIHSCGMLAVCFLGLCNVVQPLRTVSIANKVL